MPDKKIEARNILERLGDVFRVLTSQVPLKEAQRLGMPELTGLPERRLPAELTRRAQFLTPGEQALVGERRQVAPEKLKGVRAGVLPTIFPRGRAGRSRVSELLQDKTSILRALGDKEFVRRNPEAAVDLRDGLDDINQELSVSYGFKKPGIKEPRVPAPAAPGAQVGKDVETQLNSWIKTKPRIKSQKRIAGILYEYRGGDNIAIVKK